MVFPTVPNYHKDEAPLDILAALMGDGKKSIFYKNFVKSEKAIEASVYHPCREISGEFWFQVVSFPDWQEDIGIYFAKRPEDRTGEIQYELTMADDNVPFLNGSMVSFSCEVVGSHVYGDHTVYMGEVGEVRQQDEGEPLMFFKSRWYHPTKG